MTVKEIAELAGVSIGTVDRVIHKRGRVSEKTQKAIEKIINKYSYQPNPLARHLKKNCTYIIGVLIPELQSESGYWKQIYKGIKNTAEGELSAFSFQIELFEFNRTQRQTFKYQFEKMMESSCDACIIAPVLQEESLVLLSDNQITKPYCFIDSSIPNSTPVSTVTQNPYKAGYLAGRLTSLIAGHEGTYVVFKPYTEAYNQNERVRGFKEWFTKKQPLKNNILEIITKDSSYENFETEIDNLFSEHSDVTGICVVNEATHTAAEIIEKRRLKHKITITGFDLLPENRKLLLKGSIDCLISQKPITQGREVMLQLYRKFVLEKTCEKKILMPLEIYFKENVY